MKNEFNLEAFRAKRDAAIAKGMQWETTASEVLEADDACERNLEGANLYGVNLRGANLYDANLFNANLYGANLYNANLYGANLERANLRGANLEGANLRGANLERANLRGANLLNAIGIYSAYAPNLSSRGAALSGGIVLHNGKIELRFWAGCKQEITAAQLLEYVKETHGDNIHAEQYRAAIKFIQACFKSDIKTNKWDYLLDWKSPE